MTSAISKSLVDINLAYNTYLDNIADNYGVSPRQGASKSSCILFIEGTAGTFYDSNLVVFEGNGISFKLYNNTTR